MNTVLCREEIERTIRWVGDLKNLCDDFSESDGRFGIISLELVYIEKGLKAALEDARKHIYRLRKEVVCNPQAKKLWDYWEGIGLGIDGSRN